MPDNQKFYLREAGLSDLQFLFKLANDPDVRKNSFSIEKISLEEHTAWYMDLLKRDDVKQFIFMYGKNEAGQIRVSIKGEEAEISYSVAPQYRCMGCGKNMLYLITQKVKECFPDAKRLVAQVKPGNIASKKAFTCAGYKEKCSVYVFEMDGSDKPEMILCPENAKKGILDNRGGVKSNYYNCILYYSWYSGIT